MNRLRFYTLAAFSGSGIAVTVMGLDVSTPVCLALIGILTATVLKARRAAHRE